MSGAEERARLLKMLFPDGLYFESGRFRTQGKADGFSAFDLLDTPDARLATPPGLEPVSPA